MAAYLKLYLIVTGALALVAMAMPSLVILGFYMLVIPGMILAFAPTAFLWGCLFALLWWALSHGLGNPAAPLLALIGTAALLWFAPAPWSAQARSKLTRFTLDNVVPAGRFTPAGHVRVESGWPRWDNRNPAQADHVRWFACDNLCLALLFEPGVKSVTVGSASGLTFDQIRDGTVVPNRSDRTYRLVPRSECGERALQADLEGRSGLLGDTPEENEAIAALWSLRLASDVCLVGEPARAGHDMLIRSGHWRDRPADASDAGRWSWGRVSANADFIEVRTARAVIARTWNVRVAALARPLYIAWSGTDTNGYFGWGRHTVSKGNRHSQTPDVLPLLRDHSTMRRAADRAALAERLRADLAAAVANPAVAADDPVWSGIGAWVTALTDNGADAQDRALLLAMVADRRIADFPNAHKLPALFADDADALRTAIVGRILAGPVGGDPRSKPLGRLLAELPAGIFARLTPQEQTLLADPDRRRRATGLIRRLSDQGAGAVPMLVELMDYHGRQRLVSRDVNARGPERDHGHEAHRGVFDAARSALCRIGPAGSSAVPALERMQAAGYVGWDQRDWDRVLVRLGKPVESISKPANMSGSNESYRRNLRDYLNRYNPDRHCD